MADQEDFPDIYIDGSSAGDGSLASPYSDFSDINWTATGDNSIADYLSGTPSQSPTINLAKGVEWREQMTAGTSGTVTYPIVIQAYGAGADPIINGSDLVVTWTESTSWTTTWSQALDEDTGAGGDNGYRNILDAGDLTIGGHKIRLTYEGHSATQGQIDGCSIGLRSGSTEDYTLAPTRVTFNSGNNYGVIPIGGELVSDAITFTLDEAQSYLVHHFCDDGNLYFKSEGTGPKNAYRGTYQSGIDETMIQDVTHTLDAGDTRGLNKVEISYINIWQAVLATDPYAVWFDDVAGTEQTSIAACTSARDWYWDDPNDLLYVYSTIDPDTAYTSPGIEIKARTAGVFIEDKSYVTIQNLKLIRGGSGVAIWGDGSHTNFIIDNCDIDGNGGWGIIGGGHREITISNNTIHDTVVEHGVYLNDDVAPVIGAIIENNIVYNNGRNGITTRSDSAFMEDITIRYNSVYNNGLDPGGGNGMQLRGVDGLYVYYNVINCNGDEIRGLGIAISDGYDTKNATIYNNVVYGVVTSYGLFSNVGCETNVLVKNNIFFLTSDNNPIVTDSTGGATYDNNCEYSSGNYTDAWHWNGNDYSTFGDWQTGSSQDANSINSDPKFITDGSDFRLLMASPCINAGTDVSLTTDYRGRSIRHAPDMGAYEDPTNALF